MGLGTGKKLQEPCWCIVKNVIGLESKYKFGILTQACPKNALISNS
jgi:hypothetical protein